MTAPASSTRKTIAVISGVVVALALAGVFFAGRSVWFTLPLLVGGIACVISLASLIGRGYFSTAVVMAAGAFLAFPEDLTVEGPAASPGSVIFMLCTLAALVLAIIGVHHRFGNRASRRLAIAAGAMLAAIAGCWLLSARVIAATAPQYETALDACAAELKSSDPDTGRYKFLSTHAIEWHACAVPRACAAQQAYPGALCRLSLATRSRQMGAMRRAAAKVIVGETTEQYLIGIASCGEELAKLSGFASVPEYINAHPGNPDYQERIEWDLLDCGIDRVCEPYEEQRGVSQENCSAAYKSMKETENVSPRLVLMRKYSKE